ncbi:MAG TPA: signal peptidase II [Bacillota bacterium]
MSPLGKASWLPLGLVALAVIVLDRLSKAIVVRKMAEFQSIPVIPGVFHLTYVRNPGAAFSLLPDKTGFLVVVGLVVVVGIVVFGPRLVRMGAVYAATLGLILGGTLGNLWDRLRGGLVVDFLDLRVWPVFNVADSSLVVGVLILSYLIIRAPDGGPLAGDRPSGGGGET